jgi:hypothetical protein
MIQRWLAEGKSRELIHMQRESLLVVRFKKKKQSPSCGGAVGLKYRAGSRHRA